MIFRSHFFAPGTEAPRQLLKKMTDVVELVFPEPLRTLFHSGNGVNNERIFQHLVITDLDFNALACISLYTNDELNKGGKKYLVLGNYCCINNPDVATYLFETIDQFARAQGFTHLLGPMNGSTWDNYRFGIDATSADYFSEQPCPIHFSEQWKQNGFTVREKYLTTIDRLLVCDSPEVLEREQSLVTQGITIRSISLDNYLNELPTLWKFCSRTFSANVLYSSISEKRFIEKYTGLDKYLNAETTLLAENRSGELIGLLFCFPDHFCKTEKRLIIKTIARDPAPGYRGLAQVMGNRATRYARDNGFSAVIHAFMHVSNRSVTLSSQFSGTPWKHYELYEKAL